FPGAVRRQDGRVIDRKHLTTSAQRLRKTGNLADCERALRGVVLEIVLPCQAIFRAEVVVDIAVYLIRVERARRPGDGGVEFLNAALGRCDPRRRRYDKLASRRLRLEESQCRRVHLARVDTSWVP